MKNLIAILGITIFGASMGTYALAGEKGGKTETVVIKTSAKCEMCADYIEDAAEGVKGVKDAEMNMETKEVTVHYKAKKTNPDAIREAISKRGYQADEVVAQKEAYEKLPGCCKNPHKKSGS